MAISFMDGFDHYGGAKGSPPSFMSGKIGSNVEPYGFSFADDRGNEFSVRVERTEKGLWRMHMKGEGELFFAEPPHFLLAQPR